MEIIFLLLLFQIKHWLCDFTFQTYDQTVKKGIYLDPIGISHSVDHVSGSLAAFLIYDLFFDVSLPLAIVLSVIEGIIHYHIDWVKVHYGTKDITTSKFWNQFGIDQLAHQLTYLAIAILVVIN